MLAGLLKGTRSSAPVVVALLAALPWGATALAQVSGPNAAASRAEPAPIRIAQAQRARQTTRQPGSEQQRKDVLNAWTVGLAAGRIEGAPLRFAAELARVLDNGDELRVLPVVTRGIFDNIFDLLYLRGIDAAIVYGDVLDHFKSDPQIAGIAKRINYLLSLFPAELHVLARPEIKSFADLAGKTVNFNTKGTAAAYSGPIIFRQLGVAANATFVPHPVAIEKMRAGPEVAAVVFVSSKPLTPLLRGKWPAGFKLLPVEHDERLEYYVPAVLEHADYPALVPEGKTISTIAVPALLAVYDWPRESERGRRMARFIDMLIARFERLQKEPGYHPKWKDVNLAATVPGWQRYGTLQERLEQMASSAATSAVAAGTLTPGDPMLARLQAMKAAKTPAEQERLLREFLQWVRTQSPR
jgi:TRAP-type uncharacterized transport system substrate-binding protein